MVPLWQKWDKILILTICSLIIHEKWQLLNSCTVGPVGVIFGRDNNDYGLSMTKMGYNINVDDFLINYSWKWQLLDSRRDIKNILRIKQGEISENLQNTEPWQNFCIPIKKPVRCDWMDLIFPGDTASNNWGYLKKLQKIIIEGMWGDGVVN